MLGSAADGNVLQVEFSLCQVCELCTFKKQPLLQEKTSIKEVTVAYNTDKAGGRGKFMPTTVKPAASMLEGKSQQGQEQHRHKGTSPGLPGKATFSEQGFSRADPQVSRPDQEPEPSSHPPL